MAILEKFIKCFELLPFIAFYPGWVRIIFGITFVLFLVSIFLFIIMYSSALNKKKKTDLNFRITEPKEEYVSVKDVKLSGCGAPPGNRIILVTSLYGRYLALQKGSAIADSYGNWEHPRCHLENPEAHRLVYALAMDQSYEERVRELLEQHGSNAIDNAMDKFKELLKSEKIPFQLSPGRLLIRKK